MKPLQVGRKAKQDVGIMRHPVGTLSALYNFDGGAGTTRVVVLGRVTNIASPLTDKKEFIKSTLRQIFLNKDTPYQFSTRVRYN
jgi:hypothetical protein